MIINKIARVKLIIFVLIVAALCTTFVVLFQHNKVQSFPPIDVACFDQFMNGVTSGYADPNLNLPPFELKNISHFKCASKKGFEQYEIQGVDKAGHSFHIVHGAGGIAASGADGYLNYCYLKDGILVKGVRIGGRNNMPEPESCEFDEDFPVNPESTYSFSLSNSFSAKRF